MTTTTTISAGQTSSGLSITSGNVLIVLSGGTAASATVASGGVETLSSGGTTNGTVVSFGGLLSGRGLLGGTTTDAGTISGGSVIGGGSLNVTSGGKTSAVTVTSGGTLAVLGGGVATTTIINAAASQIVSSGGTSVGATVSSGGSEVISGGGTAISAVISSGGLETVASAGVSVSTTVRGAGTETITSGATALGAAVQAGGTLSAFGLLLGTITDAGLIIGGTVGGGGTTVITTGGKTSGVTVASGGTEVVSGGGTALGTVVQSGGTLVYAGGVASGLVASQGATALVVSGATAASVTVASGVVLLVSGTDSHAAVLSGGTEVVLAGGSGLAAIVSSGGTEVVSSGGFASGTTVSSSGVEVLASGAVLAYNSGSTTFNGALQGAGTLALSANAFTYAGAAGSSNVGVILQGGTLTLKASETFGGGFAFSGGGGSAVISSGATLTIGGGAILGGGSIDGPGTFVTTGVTSVSYLYLDRGLTWVNSGAVTDSGYVYGEYPSGSGSIVISNTSAGVFDLISGGAIYSLGTATETFINAGTLAEIGSGSSDVEAVVSNTGTIAVGSGGSLEFDSGGSFKGTFGGAGTIVFAGGTATLAAGKTDTFTGLEIEGGTVSSTDAITVTGTFSEQGGSLVLGTGKSFAATNFDQTGGTISLATSTTLALTGAASLSGAEIIGPGALDTTGTTNLNYLYLDGGLTWVNNGAVTDSGYVYGEYPSGSGSIVISNTSAGVFDLISGGAIYSLGTATETFINAGTFAEIGSGNSVVDAVVSNTGTIAVGSGGSLEFDSGGSFKGTFGGAGTIVFAGGTATLAAGKTDTFAGLDIHGGTVSSTDAITVTGTFSEQGGSLVLGTGKSFAATNFDQTGGTISLATNTTLANATAAGTIDLDGTTLTLTGAASLTNVEIIGPGALDTTGTTNFSSLYLDGGLAWVNSGTVNDAGVVYIDYPSGSGNVTITNAAGGVFNITSGGEIYNFGSGALNNAGTISTVGTFTDTVFVTVNNTGTITATGGTLELIGGATLGGTIGATNTKGSVLLDSGAFATQAATTATIADDGTATGLVLASNETWTDSGSILDAGHLRLGTASNAGTATLAIGTGSTFTLTGADSGIAATGTATITNAGTISQTGPTGLDTIAVGITNTGSIIAGSGTLALTGAVSGTGSLQIASGAALELGAALSTTQSVSFKGSGATLILEKPASIKLLTGFTAGDRIDLAGITATAAGTSGNVLTVSVGTTAYTFTSNLSLASDHAQFASDGAGGTIVTLYAEAAAAPHTPEPVAFGNVHVGAVATQALTITNTAPAGYAEALDASLGTATTGFVTAGTITGLGGGATNATALTITENTTTAGTLSGTAVLSSNSDGTGIDGFGTTALPAQTVTMTGAVYAYAAPTFNTTVVNLGAARVSQTGTLGYDYVSVTNGTTATPYQESLLYVPSNNTGITLGYNINPLAAGGTAQIGFLITTAFAGNFNGSTATVALTSTGVGTSGLAYTTLAPQTITINAEVFAPAVAQLAGTTVNVGIIHVGDTASAALGVTNAGSGALVDLLTAGTATVAGEVSAVSYAGLGTGVTAGSGGGGGTVSLSLNTATAGTISGSAIIGFDSHDSALADLAIAGGTVAVTGTIDNYAAVTLEDTGGAGTLTGSGTGYVLNLGTVAQGAAALTADLGVINSAVGPADLLGGSYAASGSSAFTNTGTAAFSGLAAGQADVSPVVTLTTGTAGMFTETLVVSATGGNASGYSGALAAETITVTGTVVSNGTTYTLTGAPTTIAGTTGNDTINAASNTLNSHDTISGAGGVNTLNLTGGGYFDLGAPASLTSIQVVTAQESAAGTTVFMRNSLNVTLDVTPGGGGSLLIYGGTDSDVYNLGAGVDTVVVGAKTETVNAGGGTALVQATSTLAGVLVNGGSVGSAGTTTLELTTGGTAALNGADANLIVKLDAASNLSLSTATFITAEGAAAGGDTITAGGASQTLESLGGKDTLVGAASYGDTFLGASAGFAGDTIKTFGGTDTIDITDMLYASLKPLTYSGNTTSGKLGIADGTHSVSLTMSGSYTLGSFAPSSDGHGGTLISFV